MKKQYLDGVYKPTTINAWGPVEIIPSMILEATS